MEMFIELGLDTIVFAILLYGITGLKGHKAIVSWRIVTIISLVGLFVYIILEKYVMLGLAIALAVNCLIVFPLTSQNNMCPKCGRSYYWKSLFSNQCSYCKN